ncbi:MAG: S1 RNA-binding domain-containing protein, partial [Candidatus Acidiferrales bacterium]
MSPEHDPNVPTSTVESVQTDPPEENSAAISEPFSGSGMVASASTAAGSRGAATAVARAQVPVIQEPPSVEESPAPAETDALASAATAEAPATAATSPEIADTTEVTAAIHTGEPIESVEASETTESTETMDQLMDQFAVPEPVAAEGEIFDGRVLAVTDAGVIVDVGGKFEGLVPAQEFVDSGSPIEFGPGQTIEVERLHSQKDGYVLLSHVRAHRRRVWERIEKSYREHATITGKVTERIKGGLVVDIGVRSFLPASQIELRPVHDLDGWKDKDIDVRVLKLNRKRGNVVVSRRAILEEDQKSKRDTLMASLSEGAIVTGKVKNVTDYGVFVDLGGMDGLLHVSDLVWGRVPHPSSIVKAGDELQVQILKFDKDKQRISLGRKQLLPDPWATVPERFPVGTRVQGKIVGVTDYGAFVQIEPGVEGLVHV